MAGKPHILVLFRHFGPYHVARLDALAKSAQVTAIEFARDDGEYPWNVKLGAHDFAWYGLCEAYPVRLPARAAAGRKLAALINAADPDVVAVPGWSEPLALAALATASRRGIPAIAMSDSKADDFPRKAVRERIKRLVLSRYSAALVAGSAHHAYLVSLDFPPGRIVTGYDVVDNRHFSDGAASARAAAPALRGKFDLPPVYFLASVRFIAKKNLDGLLDAYRIYRDAAGAGAWDLVIIGDGPLRGALEAAADNLGIGDHVHMPGFADYGDLPIYYGLAGAFVLPSHTDQWGLVVNEAMAAGLPVLVSAGCGSAGDLVEEGGNGFTFDPSDRSGLAGLMARLSDGSSDLKAMGEASGRIIESWDLDRFSTGMSDACRLALEAGAKRSTLIDKAILTGLALR
jgi:glycosyltransferase involved in cell wall biosynthesis